VIAFAVVSAPVDVQPLVDDELQRVHEVVRHDDDQ
jgi:hypothetical protein